PFTMRQLHSTRAMQVIQPRMQEIQKKYKDPKRRQEETMKLYRESGVNPLGCFLPMAIQMLVFIALYRALGPVVGGSPESVVDLSQRVYPWAYLTQSVPLEQSFLWLELGQADTTFILPLMVGVSTYVQTRLSATPATTPQQQQQQQMMTWMMPLVLVWITLSLPSGVGVYWVVSNVFSVFASYLVYGRRMSWRNLLPTTAATEVKKASPKLQPACYLRGPNPCIDNSLYVVRMVTHPPYWSAASVIEVCNWTHHMGCIGRKVSLGPAERFGGQVSP
ncbi:hypothetical protein LCGC14_2798180, partial [marine sediment metagenome]